MRSSCTCCEYGPKDSDYLTLPVALLPVSSYRPELLLCSRVNFIWRIIRYFFLDPEQPAKNRLSVAAATRYFIAS